MKNLNTLGSRLKHARLKRELKQWQLAEAVQTKQQTIQQIESDKIKETSLIVHLAKKLNVSADWLQYGSEIAGDDLPAYESATSHLAPHQIPILEWAEITSWCKDNKKFVLGKNRDYLPSLANAGERSYALRINNDTMVAPRSNMKSFHKGSIIVVDPDHQPTDGCYVISLMPPAKEATFKQYVVDGSIGYLKPLNPQYPAVKKEAKAKICGVVVAYLDLVLT